MSLWDFIRGRKADPKQADPKPLPSQPDTPGKVWDMAMQQHAEHEKAVLAEWAAKRLQKLAGTASNLDAIAATFAETHRATISVALLKALGKQRPNIRLSSISIGSYGPGVGVKVATGVVTHWSFWFKDCPQSVESAVSELLLALSASPFYYGED